MDAPLIHPSPAANIPLATAAELLTHTSICPACGYPSLGMDLCAYCRPLAHGFTPAPGRPA